MFRKLGKTCVELGVMLLRFKYKCCEGRQVKYLLVSFVLESEQLSVETCVLSHFDFGRFIDSWVHVSPVIWISSFARKLVK